MFKRDHIIRFAMTAFLAAFGTFVAAESLQDVLSATSKDNPQIQAARIRVDQQRSVVEQERAGKRPQIIGSIGVNHSDVTDATNPLTGASLDNQSNTLSAQISGELLIFDGGQTNSAIAAQEARLAASKFEVTAVEQQIYLSAIRAYVQVLLARDNLNLQETNYGVVSRQLQATRIAFDEGASTISDLAFVEANLAVADAEIASAQANLDSAEETFRSIVGRMPAQLSKLSVPKLPATKLEAEEEALRTSPSAKAAIEYERAAQYNLRRAQEARSRPTVKANASLGSQYDLDEDSRNDQLSVGVSGTMPIYTGGKLSAIEAQARAGLELAGAESTRTRAEIRQQVATTWSNYQASKLQVEASKAQMLAQSKVSEAANVEYELGAKSIIDKMAAEKDLLRAEIGLLNAEYTQVFTAYSLLALLGRLQVTPSAPSYTAENKTPEAEPTPDLSEGAKAVEVLRGRWVSE